MSGRGHSPGACNSCLFDDRSNGAVPWCGAVCGSGVLLRVWNEWRQNRTYSSCGPGARFKTVPSPWAPRPGVFPAAVQRTENMGKIQRLQAASGRVQAIAPPTSVRAATWKSQDRTQPRRSDQPNPNPKQPSPKTHAPRQLQRDATETRQPTWKERPSSRTALIPDHYNPRPVQISLLSPRQSEQQQRASGCTSSNSTDTSPARNRRTNPTCTPNPPETGRRLTPTSAPHAADSGEPDPQPTPAKPQRLSDWIAFTRTPWNRAPAARGRCVQVHRSFRENEAGPQTLLWKRTADITPECRCPSNGI